MNFLKRLEGVFFSPKATFQALSEKPAWADMLIFLLILLAVYSLLVSPYSRHDQLQMMKDSPKLKERMGEGYDKRIQQLENPPTVSEILFTGVGAPVFALMALLLQAVVLIVLGRFVSTQGTYKQVFSSLVHASAVNIVLGNAFRLVLVLLRKSAFQTSTSLALFFPSLEVTSKAYIVLSQVDFFQLWLFGILAFGLSAVFKIDLKKSLFLSYVLWFLKALVNLAIGIVTIGALK